MRRRSIRLTPHEREMLLEFYMAFRIPTDQYKQRPNQAAMFLNAWQMVTSRTDTWEDLIHYMVTQRKAGKWVRLGDEYERLRDPGEDALSPAEWSHLNAAYHTVVLSQQMGSDNLVYFPALRSALAREFARLSGRVISGELLTAMVMARRKGGELARLNPPAADQDMGFSDIDEVAC